MARHIRDPASICRQSRTPGHLWYNTPTETKDARIQRFFGALVLGLKSPNATILTVHSSDNGIQLEPAGDRAGRQQVGQWELRQSRPKEPVTIAMVMAKTGQRVMISSAENEPARVDSLALDRCTCIAEDRSESVSIVTPAGTLSAGDPASLVPFAADARSIASRMDLGVFRSDDGKTFVAQRLKQPQWSPLRAALLKRRT